MCVLRSDHNSEWNPAGLPSITVTIRTYPGTVPEQGQIELQYDIKGLQMDNSHYKVSAYAEDLLFTKYIWGNKRPRIQGCLLTLPKMFGGIPDIQKYHQATHLTWVIDWCRHGDQKLWTQLEQFSTIPLHRAPWCFQALPPVLKVHPAISPTLRVCNLLFKNLAITTT